MKNIIFISILSLWLVSCSIHQNSNTNPQINSSNNGNSNTNSSNINIFSETILDLNTTTQTLYKKQWLENTKHIVRGSYLGYVDIWGGGELELYLWFQDGNLWDSMITLDDKPYILYHLLDDKIYPARFIDGKTAIVMMPSSASPKLSGSLYVLLVSNNTIYRSKNTDGFSHKTTWNKKLVPQHELVSIAKKIKNGLSSEMIIGGHLIEYQRNNNDPISLVFSNTDTVQQIGSLQKIMIDGETIYLDNNFIYKNNAENTYEIHLDNKESFKYTLEIKNHKIIKIVVTRLFNNNFLNPNIFQSDLTYYKIVYSTQGPPQAHGWRTNISTIKSSDISVNPNKEGNNIIWIQSSGSINMDVPLRIDLPIRNIVEYTVGKTDIKLIFDNKRNVVELYKKN